MKISKLASLSVLAGLACTALMTVYLNLDTQSQQAAGGVSPVTAEQRSEFRQSVSARAQAERRQKAAKPRAQAPLVFELAAPLAQPYRAPLPAGTDPRTLPAPKQVLSSALVKRSSLPAQLASLKTGQKIGLPLPDGSSRDGRVNLVKTGADGVVRVGGSLLPAGEGSFSLSQRGQTWTGMIQLPVMNRGYVLETMTDGGLVLQEHRLDELLCLGMKRKEGDPGLPEAALAAGAPQNAVPILDTRPAALGVIYIDFDGETVTDSDWNDGNPIVAVPPSYNGLPLTNAHITSVVEAVAEDFAPFDVTVTTDLSRYLAAPAGRRMRCIVTPTDPITEGAAAGVAYLNSWAEAGGMFDDDVPCWCFGMYDPASMALVISHEVGHTFGLRHDGTATLAYYGGHTNAGISWGPIMGAPYGRTMTQWSIGDYASANNTEDDVAIISNLVNDVGFITDEAGDSVLTALDINVINGVVNRPGILAEETDSDWYKITSFNGPLSIVAVPTAVEENVDVLLEIRDEDGTVVAASSPTANRSATLNTNLTEGTYFLSVSPSGDGANPSVGYSAYGSLGAYRLTGSYTPIPSAPLITQQPESVEAVDGSTVTLSVQALSSGGLTYEWYRNGSRISGATAATLKLTKMDASKAGDYHVVVINPSNPTLKTSSDIAVVTVNLRPVITEQPVSPSGLILAGTPHTFSVTATGTGPLQYTWEKIQKPANLVVGTDSPDLLLPSVTLADAGSYRVLVTNATGVVVVSKTVTLKVDSPPVILSGPAANLIITEGASGALKVVVGGRSPFTYEWFKVNGMDEDPVGGNSPTLSLPGLPANAGLYRVKVSNALSGDLPTVSSDALVEVDAKPTILSGPVSGQHEAGDDVTLEVVAGGSAVNRTYQWFKDNRPIGGANGATLHFPTIAWVDRGAYSVVVTNRVGTVKSKPAVLAVRSKPVILVQPASVVGAVGGSVSFTVVAGGDTPLTYQWYRNGAPIDKATKPKLVLSKLVDGPTGPEGDFFCRVANGHAGGPTDTAIVTLEVEQAPAVSAIAATNPDPGAQPNKVAEYGSITLTPTVTGTAPFSYQWLKSGKPIVGATDPTLILNPARLPDSGAYSVQVSNRTPVVAKSKAVSIGVLVPPSISAPPVSASVTEYRSASFQVKAAGGKPLKYQWQRLRDGLPENLSGKTSATLSFSSATVDDAGDYQCLVSNPVGRVTSPVVSLSVTPTPPSQIVDFQPTRGRATEKILVTGTNLDFVSSAKIGTTATSMVKISSTQVMLTVPAGLAVEQPSAIQLISRAGTAVSTGFFTRTAGWGNDAVIDSVIVSGTVFAYSGNNSGFTANEAPDLVNANVAFTRASAWVWWTAPRSGQYEIKVSSQVDMTLARYTGKPGGGLTFNSFVDGGFDGTPESLTFNATEGQDMVFRVGGWAADDQGGYQLQLRPLAFSMPRVADFEGGELRGAGTSVAGLGAWQQEGGDAATVVEAEASRSVRLGGEAATGAEPVILWDADSKAPAGTAEVVASVKMQVDAPAEGASADRFGWTVYSADKAPVAALWVDARDGQLYCTAADGTQTQLEPKLVSGTQHKLEITLNQETWTVQASLDGVKLVENLPVPAGSQFGDISAIWVPSADGSPHASMTFDDLTVLFRPAAE